jgi:hypothetical protein
MAVSFLAYTYEQMEGGKMSDIFDFDKEERTPL